MAFAVAMTVSYVLAAMGFARVGALLLVQWGAGLRPSEALELTRETITPSWLNKISLGDVVITLGAKRGTKIGRAQTVVIRRHEGPIAVKMIEALYRSTPPGSKLVEINGYQAYCELLRKACNIARLTHVGFTPHSPRAGWASEKRLAGVSFEEIRERGRWSTDTALRIYLDLSTVASQALSLADIANFGLHIAENVDQRFPWWHH